MKSYKTWRESNYSNDINSINDLIQKIDPITAAFSDIYTHHVIAREDESLNPDQQKKAKEHYILYRQAAESFEKAVELLKHLSYEKDPRTNETYGSKDFKDSDLQYQKSLKQ